ncbi:protein of unknown function [Taphrina deformans PYCC 5710]|uniref:Oxidoreductase NAD-binding domain-containing protein 1 n=1 Tax=Taphrina deformans (strain PYCC 5710 / ATCC 11124 / CBS 356.35 / IMI 108563 / JCM 9778 / NBRC 8474) TaxID=1097556 RepID=R4XCV7_TAPDE|nr:protein of unknown function [Taphrina deformans PYCC 5710]|eukprot:CCG83705.1 protein of unknown function [Taphrina deformans PYCC 5710]
MLKQIVRLPRTAARQFNAALPGRTIRKRFMATAATDGKDDPAGSSTASHGDRTAGAPRAKDLHRAVIRAITQATADVRLIDLAVSPAGRPFRFRAGQWVDTYTPGSEQAGGFSIVSSPAQGEHHGTFRLAVQRADRNPSAAWLWRPREDLIGTPGSSVAAVDVRVGGQFTFPPVNVRKLAGRVTRVTLVAGGIGSNPLMSILGALRDAGAPLDVAMLYCFRTPADALYLDQLADLCRHIRLDLSLFCSRGASDTDGLPGTVHHRRMNATDLDATLPPEPDTNLYYVCGPAQMTDFVQQHLLKQGVLKDLVQTERWW